MRGISDAQQSSVIAVVAKIPVAEARKPFLVELEKQLPKTGKVGDETLLACINAALKSFPPGAYCGDAQGVFPPITEDISLKEAAMLYERVIRPSGEWCWPPIPPTTPEEAKAKAERLAALSQEQKAEAYARTLYETEEDYQAAKADEEKRRQAEETADATPWPLPVTTKHASNTRRGGAQMTSLNPSPAITPLAERVRPKQLSIYGRAAAFGFAASCPWI